MAATQAEILRVTNAMIRNFLRDAQPALDSKPDIALICPQINSLWLRLDEVGKRLRSEPADAQPNAELQAERALYAKNLERLRDALEGVSRHLIAHRAELEAQRARLQRVNRWVAATKFAHPDAVHSAWKVTVGD